MNVLINILSAKAGGGVTYVRCIIPHLVKQAKGVKFTLLFSSKYQKELVTELSNYVIKLHDTLLPANPMLRFLWEQAVLPFLVKKLKVDLYFQVTESCPLFVSCPVVVMARNSNIYQPIREIKNWNNLWWKATRLPVALLSFKKAKKIIFVSDTFRRYVQKKYGLPLDKTYAVYHGLDAMFLDTLRQKKKIRLRNSPYILSVSNFMPHKNYTALIRAFNILLKRDWSLPYHLKIAGKKDRFHFPKVRDLVNNYKLKERIHFLGLVPYNRLLQLYQRASLFVLPSRLETFGLPLIEAMASGVPVVASNLDVISEICQDAAVYFDPFNPEDIAEKMLLVLNNHQVQENLRKRGLKRAKDFSWEKTAKETLRVFEEVYNNS